MIENISPTLGILYIPFHPIPLTIHRGASKYLTIIYCIYIYEDMLAASFTSLFILGIQPYKLVHPVFSQFVLYLCMYIYTPCILGILYILLHPRTLPLHPGESCIQIVGTKSIYVYIRSPHPGNPLHPSSSSATTPTPWCILCLTSLYYIYICIDMLPAS